MILHSHGHERWYMWLWDMYIDYIHLWLGITFSLVMIPLEKHHKSISDFTWHRSFGTRSRYSRQVLLVLYWISNITCLTLVVRTIQFNQTNFLGWWYVNVCVFYDIQELDVLDDLSYYSCVYGTPLFVHTKMSCQQGCKACYQPISI